MPLQRPDRPVNIPLRRRAATTVDVILGMRAAVATPLLMALIARDAIGMPLVMVREDALIAARVVSKPVANHSPAPRR
jgi:hypothetical protein